MTRLDFDPDLERLGDALRASTTTDLASEQQAAHASRPDPGRAARSRVLRRPRILAGGTLGLAGVGAALVLALGGTSAAPAFAVTRQNDGSVLVTVNFNQAKAQNAPWLRGADLKLAAMGIDEQINAEYQPGTAASSRPVTCAPMRGVTTPTGPPIKVLLGTDGTQAVPSGTTGAGTTLHIGSCVYYTTPTPIPGGDGTGNSGAG
jgi:hypothetical protein